MDAIAGKTSGTQLTRLNPSSHCRFVDFQDAGNFGDGQQVGSRMIQQLHQLLPTVSRELTDCLCQLFECGMILDVHAASL
jgi:hypothetical protein